MELYRERLARILAETGALFFDDHLVLKDGRPTPYFVNMAMFKTGRLCLELGSFFAGMMEAKGLVEKTDVVLGPSYKGSAIALATVIALWREKGRDLLFEYDRKEAKTHGEASKAKTMFVNGAFFDGCRIFVVDDVATSMGTKHELLAKIRSEAEISRKRLHVIGIGIGVNREQTTAVYDEEGCAVLGQRGEDSIAAFVSDTGIPVYAVAGIREMVEFLYVQEVPVLVRGTKRPLDPETKAQFDDYLETYGTPIPSLL
jgi:orotate phosphoribosyltransferase